MKLDLDTVEAIEPFELTVDKKQHTFDLLEMLFKFRQKLGGEDVPKDPTSLKTLISEVLGVELNLTQALVTFRALMAEGETQVDNLLKNALGTSPQSTTTTPDSVSKISENSDDTNS